MVRSVFEQVDAQVIASKHLFDGSGKLKWVYRELAPSTPEDTGWFLFADNDSDEWNNDPTNFMPIVVETALVLEPSLAHVLDLPYGTDLILATRGNVTGWWEPKTKTPVYLFED